MSKKPRSIRLNSMRLLDAQGISYEVVRFSPAIHSATEVAHAVHRDPGMVYKTLVVERSVGRPMLVMIAAHKQLDLSALAGQLGEKKLRMATQDRAEALTGLQVGGISALALLNKGFDVYIDQAAQDLEQIMVSGGQRGIDLCLTVADLVQVTGSRWVHATAEISKS